MTYVAQRFNDMGRPAWIAATLVAFWFWWPIGLALLVYKAFTRDRAAGQWQFPAQIKGMGRSFGFTATSGNRAFDEYRTETLHRLEEEQKEFVEYLDRLRQARDKAEFDQFMADRRRPVRTDETQHA